MTLSKTYSHQNPDGTAHYVYASDKPLVYTGPISGLVTLPDGTVYDVTEAVIEVESEEHAAHVSDAIGKRYAVEGHPVLTRSENPEHHAAFVPVLAHPEG